MATIHRTTMTPGKLEMIAAWLPSRSWFRGSAAPVLARAGGFRLDDPDGEVGLEFTLVRDEQGDEPVSYLVLAAFRGAPLEGGQDAFIATAEHGVLGARWLYDGAADPVFLTQLGPLLAGVAIPQAQNVSDTVEPAVTVQPSTVADLQIVGPARDEGGSTVLPARVAGTDRLVQVHRVLRQDTDADVPAAAQVLAPLYSALDADGRATGDGIQVSILTVR